MSKLYEGMTRDQLLQAAEVRGIEVPSKATKAENLRAAGRGTLTWPPTRPPRSSGRSILTSTPRTSPSEPRSRWSQPL